MTGVEVAVIGGKAVTLTHVGIAAGLAMSAFSSVSQARQAEASGRYNAALHNRDAQIAEQEARFQADQQRQRTQSLLASQRAISGASGVGLTGDSLLAQTESAAVGEMDALAIMYGGNVEAVRARASAAAARFEGAGAAWGGFLKAGSTLLTGGSRLANDIHERSLLDEG